MQDPMQQNRPIREDRPLEDRPVEDRSTIVDARSGGSGAAGWAVAAIVAVLVAGGVFYFTGSGTGDGVDPNANTSSITTEEPAPFTPPTDGQATGSQPAPQPVQPDAAPTTGGNGQ